MTCPACGGGTFEQRRSADQIAQEIELRGRFIRERFDHRPQTAELMDLTEFMHGGPGRLVSCRRCGLVMREEARAAHYEDDLYDTDLMAHLYPRYLEAFRHKQAQYRTLLRPHARVIELGSHLGAFLQTAEEWDWRPIGLDIGKDTSAFARSRGGTVRRKAIEDFSLRERPAEAMFIWNCFEQMEDPASTLARVHRLLEPRGLLVVRVPNVEFYERWQGAVKRLGYNNLLGFPYRVGYTAEALVRLLRRFGFTPVAGHNSSLITVPIPDMPRWVRRESADVQRGVEPDGPWIEIVSRREL